jgi:nucleoside-diphosphate-sugar epimerase
MSERVAPPTRRRIVAVTGSSGTLGSRIVQRLRAERYEVVGLDLRAPDSRADVTFRHCDVRQPDSVLTALADADVVIHTAALHGAHAGSVGFPDFLATNVGGTSNVVMACESLRVRRLVLTSSTSIYGASTRARADAALWLDERAPLCPTDVYDATKVAAEQIGAALATTNTQVVALRVARFFFDDYVRYNVRKLNRGIDADDAAAAHVRAAFAPVAPAFAVFNVCARTPFQRADVSLLARDAQSVIDRRCPGARRLFEERGWSLPTRIDRVYDGSKAERELGFRPRQNFEEFLALSAEARVPPLTASPAPVACSPT